MAAEDRIGGAALEVDVTGSAGQWLVADWQQRSEPAGR